MLVSRFDPHTPRIGHRRRRGTETRCACRSARRIRGPHLRLGRRKLAAEWYLAVLAQLYGLSLASVGFFLAYGSSQCKQVVFDLLAKSSEDHDQLFIHGD